jgi:two-component system, LytTR family, sensor histidine kinase AlgZ
VSLPVSIPKWYHQALPLVWIPLAVLLGALLYITDGMDVASILVQVLPTTFLIAAIVSAARYTCRSLPVRRYPLWRIVVVHFVDSIIAATLAMGLAWLIIEGIAYIDIGLVPVERQDGLTTVFSVTLLAYLWSVTYHYLIVAVEETVRAENRVVESEYLASDAELKALRAKLNPHFLFNSLNSIAALTVIDGERAREMCVTLADFMRQSLTLGSRRSIPLSEEMALIRAYLSVEQVRFQDRMQVEESIEPGATSIEVPPLLLQPLVENAVKHGVAAMAEAGWVRIDIASQNDIVNIVIENPIAEDAPVHAGTGQGLAIARRRLASYFGDDSSLRDERIAGEPALFRVTLALPK